MMLLGHVIISNARYWPDCQIRSYISSQAMRKALHGKIRMPNIMCAEPKNSEISVIAYISY